MAEFKIGRLRFTWAGPWEQAKFYNRDAVTQYNGKTYVCLVPHTSDADFYSDLKHITLSGASTPYWTIMTEGTAWKNDWAPTTVYSLGNIIKYGGVVYVCSIEHTSGTSFDITKWTTYSKFDNWNNAWQTQYAYGIGDVVKYGGIVYRCTINHVSAGTNAGGLEADLGKWGIVNSGVEYKTNWQSSTRYKLNDIAKLGPDLYIATEGHTSANAFDETKWDLWLPGIEFGTTWNSGTAYQPGDVVIYGGYSYTSNTVNNTNNIPSTDSVDWTLLTQGYNIQGEWTSGNSYKVGDTVRRNGSVFAAVADNSNQDPTLYSVSTTHVAPVYSWNPSLFGGTVTQGPPAGPGIFSAVMSFSVPSQSFEIVEAWTTGQSMEMTINGTATHTYTLAQPISGSNGSYTVLFNETFTDYGTVTSITFTGIDSSITLTVQSAAGIKTGMTIIGSNFTTGQYVTSVSGSTVTLSAKADATPTPGQDVAFVGVNYLYWTLVTSGNYWTNRWSDGIIYAIGDLVVWKNTTYTCLQRHLSDLQKRPDVDDSHTYWAIYVAHDRKNALTRLGDLEFFLNGEPSTVEIGSNDLILKNVSGTPTWSTLNIINKVYYVTPDGEDRADYGITWDRPWKTIKYACEFVRAGVLAPNAKTLLELNKEWMVEEVYQYIAYEAQSGALTSYTDYLTDETKLKRDARLIVDAILYDVARGGNSQSVYAARSYFAQENSNKFINQATADKIQYFIPALTYLKSLMPLVLNKISPTVNYQALNNVVSEIEQAKPAGYNVETSVANTISDLMDIVINALTTESTVGLPTPNQGLTSTIMVKTGTYEEELPIVIPENTALVGDELRGTIVKPKNVINTRVLAANATTSLFTVKSTAGIADGVPVQFLNRVVNGVTSTIGGVDHGVNYYVIGSSIANNQFAVSATLNDKFNCNTVINETTLRNVTSFTGLSAGTPLFGPGLQAGTKVVSTNPSTLTVEINLQATATATNQTMTYAVGLSTGTGTAVMYGGDAVKDMFYVRNATGVRNMTLTGLLGTMTELNQFGTRRPTGGAFTSLDPGTGPNDTSVWIIKRSPYIQNVTNFGTGCTGLKIDGTLHNGGNKSIVCNDYTQILGDSIGVWCTGPGALTECVSVFSYYGYSGYFAEDGGRIRATNGNSSYGDYGCIAEGYDITEQPITGFVYNRSQQVQASVQSAFGSSAELVRLNYKNSGGGYNTQTTNLLKYSNHYDTTSNWTTDGNVSFAQTAEAPTGYSEAWRLTGATTGSGDSYVYQNTDILPAGATYTGLTAVNITGNGGVSPNTPATFDVTVTSTGYVVTVNTGGSGYVSGNEMFISGGELGGLNNVNDCFITVGNLAGSSILTVSVTGTVPAGSAQSYTLSAYVKQGTAASIDLYGIFSGSSSVTSSINYNFLTNTITPSNANGGFLPVNYGAISLPNGWYRLWFALNDTTGLNNNLQYRIYPRGYSGIVSTFSYVYGSQTEISSSTYAPSFYLETTIGRYTSYANYQIVGAGTGAEALGDELRSGAIFETRVTDPGSGAGGRGYLTASNNAQSGGTTYVQLAQSDINLAANYVGMRVFINSGTGSGRYGFISAYEPSSKIAQVLKESFDVLEVTNTETSTNLITLANTVDTSTLYVDQPIQFIPTYYTVSVASVSQATQSVSETVGGSTNTVIVASTAQMTVNMPVTFGGNTFGGLTANYTYYISEIIDSQTITVSAELYGTAQPLSNASNPTLPMSIQFPANTSYIAALTEDMQVNLPIQFTGTSIGGINVGQTYYINDVIDDGTFTISGSLVTVSPSASSSSNNGFTVTTTSSLTNLNPIVFSGTVFGNVVEGTKYYISKIINSSTFSIASSLLNVEVTQTASTSNLITVNSTAGFIANNPIIFTGTTFGNLVAETVYYVLAINNDTTFTVSQTPGGSAVTLTNAAGLAYGRTAPASFNLITTSGTMTGTTTSTKTRLTSGSSSLNATFSTTLFGNVEQGVTYYVDTIDALNNQIIVTATQGSGIPVPLATKTGSMNIGSVGWDHINPGQPTDQLLDSSSVYFIEPRTTFTDPEFTQTASTMVTLAPGTVWTDIAYGKDYWMALPSGNATAAGSSNGTTWNAITLPSTQNWSKIAYGNNYWVAVTSDDLGTSIAARSNSNGLGWRTSNLPSTAHWDNLVYGNGKFVTIATGTSSVAYSTNYGGSWSTGSGLPSANWTGLAYGAGKFLAVASGVAYTGVTGTNIIGTGSSATFKVTTSGPTYTIQVTNGGTGYAVNDTIKILGTAVGGATPANDITVTIATLNSGMGDPTAISSITLTGTAVSKTAAFSADGITWVTSTLPVTGTWSAVEYGNGRFVAVSSTSALSAYSFDGTTWYTSDIPMSATKLAYGQGVFLAITANSDVAYTSEGGNVWKTQTVSNSAYSMIGFGYKAATKQGVFLTSAGTNTGSVITAGTRAKARPVVTSGVITSMSQWESGSGYTVTPSVTFADPNITQLAVVTPRIGDGSLGNPSWINRGTGYNTTSTVVSINGNGYSDSYQTGLTLIMNNLSRLPLPGDNLEIQGNSEVYKVTSASAVYGSVAPNIEANVQIAPDMSVALSPENLTPITIRQKYSQVRLTGHDFLNVGYGDVAESNYPGLPPDNTLQPQNQTVEINYGRVFFTSTDQDGNFKVGNLFGVQQATGIVTLSASQFGLTGLETLSLGGIAVGGSSVLVRQFSTDSTFIANSDEIIPTQKAIKAYLTGRLSQGGANTFTGQLIAGTVLVGGPNKISSTIPNGVVGSVVNMPNKINFTGEFAGVDGGMTAMAYFMKHFSKR